MRGFLILGAVRDMEVIARGRGIRNQRRLLKAYGGRRWRKCKGVATVQFADGAVREAELHWYEANGVGRVEIRIKRTL